MGTPKRKKVVILDDGPPERGILAFQMTLLSSMLEIKQYTSPRTCMDGLTGEESLCILDVSIAGLKVAFELCKEIKQKFPNLPVFFLSGDASQESQNQSQEVGAEAYIIKPVTSHVLGKKMQSCLG